MKICEIGLQPMLAIVSPLWHRASLGPMPQAELILFQHFYVHDIMFTFISFIVKMCKIGLQPWLLCIYNNFNFHMILPLVLVDVMANITSKFE